VVLETKRDDQAKAVELSASREVTVIAGSKMSSDREKITGCPLLNSFPTQHDQPAYPLPPANSLLVSRISRRLHCTLQRSYSSVSFPFVIFTVFNILLPFVLENRDVTHHLLLFRLDTA
jgi:hypothetical protein